MLTDSLQITGSDAKGKDPELRVQLYVHRLHADLHMNI